MPLTGDRAWRVVAEEGRLLLTAGADAVWSIEDVPSATAMLVTRFWSPTPPDDGEIDDAARPVVEHLAAAGVLRPRAACDTPRSLGVRFAGDEVPAFTAALARRTGSVSSGMAGKDGLTVLVRTNGALRDLTSLATELAAQEAPHLLCDLAYHHTVVLGPHVVPGDTACLACLVERVSARWGDPDPPRRPAANDDAELAALLLGGWLERSADPDATLVNASVTFDLTTLSATREAVWRVPRCGVCGDWAVDGRIDLPHAAAEARS